MEKNSPLFDIFNLVMVWIYFSVLDSSSWQASVGKKALGLKIVDKNGDRISFGRATGRHFAKIISGLTILIGYMLVGWTKRKEGLHDMIAGTLVIRIEKKAVNFLLQCNIPTCIHISEGKLHDVNILALLIPEPGAFYSMEFLRHPR